VTILRRRTFRTVWGALIWSGLILAVGAAAAAASITIGQAAANTFSCTGNDDWLQPSVTSGNSYVVPATGTITSWTTNDSAAGQQLTMKMYRKVGDPATYKVVGHAGPQALTPDGVAGNTFPANIAVQPGDVLGFHTVTSFGQCAFSAPGEQFLISSGDLADGASGPFNTNSSLHVRLDIQATLVLDNSFSLGATERNKKKGTATLNLTLPNPGDLSASGNGAQIASSSAQAVISKSVGAGQAQLLVKATGTKRKRLNQNGKVKLNISVTYTPTFGDPSTQSVKVKLKKNL
jgi:hypothetical protein